MRECFHTPPATRTHLYIIYENHLFFREGRNFFATFRYKSKNYISNEQFIRGIYLWKWNEWSRAVVALAMRQMIIIIVTKVFVLT